MSNYHQITFDNAATYLHQYLQNDALLNVANEKSIGATIPLGKFIEALSADEHGIAFWFCWNNNLDLDVPEYFMAWELNRFNPDVKPPISILNNILTMPKEDCIFTYPETTPPSLDQTKTFLQNHNPGSTAGTMEISKTNVQTLNNNYMSDFPDGTSHPEFTKVNCCFFSSKDLTTGNDDDGFLAFTEQEDIKYVRYYFCLVKNAEDNIVYPKLILFGVDAAGRNLTADKKIKLELSWP